MVVKRSVSLANLYRPSTLSIGDLRVPSGHALGFHFKKAAARFEGAEVLCGSIQYKESVMRWILAVVFVAIFVVSFQSSPAYAQEREWLEREAKVERLDTKEATPLVLEPRTKPPGCTVGNLNAPAFAIVGFAVPPEEYRLVFDPQAGCSSCPSGLRITTVHVLMRTAQACDVVMAVNVSAVSSIDPSCPDRSPGTELCNSGSFNVNFPDAGIWDVGIPITCDCLSKDQLYLLGFEYVSSSCQPEPDLVIDATPTVCTSWNDFGSGWLDLVTTFGFPGNLVLYADADCCESITELNLDIKPGSCPNPFNLNLFNFVDDGTPKKGGVLPVAILGDAAFDVHDIDVSTLLLESVPPLAQGGGPKVGDVAAPVGDNTACNCTTNGPDGFDDLKMKFSSLQIADAIAQGQPGDELMLTLTGQLLDGTPFLAKDCIRFVGRETPPVIAVPESDVTLSPPVPNPFNPVTRIGYYLPEDATVQLIVYDVKGRQIATLVDGPVTAGEHIVTWKAVDAPSGIYFYRLTAGDFRETRKMILLK
jgi:hypothetical protein